MALAVLPFGLAPTSTRALDLSECIQRALDRSPDLAYLSADLAAANAKLEEARAGRFGAPEYTQIFGLVNRAHGDPVYSPDSKNAILTGLGPFTRLRLAIDVPIWTFGKISSAIDAAEHGVDGIAANGRSKRADVVLDTKRLYYQLALTQQLTLVLRDLLDTMDKAVKKATNADLLKLRIGRAKLAKGLYEVEASVELTKSALARAIGGEATLQIADQKIEPISAVLEPLDAYVAGALRDRPEQQALASGIEAQRATVDMERAAYYPTIALATGVELARATNRDEQVNPFAWDEFNFIRPIAALALRWNLNFWLTHGRVDEADAGLVRLEAKRAEAASGLALEVRRAYVDVDRARRTMIAAEDGSKAGRALMVSAVSNFDLGFGEARDLFDALTSYAESHADYLHAIYDYNVALGALSRAAGREVTGLVY
jgi:outer membrane protein TolC